MARRSQNPVSLVVVVAVSGIVALSVGYFFVNQIAHRVDMKKERIISVVPRVAVLSARRTPSTLSSTTRIDRVKRTLSSFSTRLPTGSCLAVSWQNETMLDVRAQTAFIPASSTKVITAAVALEVLGKDFTYSTNVHANIDPNGVVVDLYFVGGGDPNLIRSEYPSLEKYPTTSGTSMEKLADAVVAAGVRQIAGSVVGVDDRYNAQRFVSVWPSSFHMTEAGPLGALFVDDGMILGQQIKPDDPALSAAQELTNMLQARGVVIGALPRHETLPSEVPIIASVTSSPLPQVLQEMLVNSDNNTAELLLKEIGFAVKQSGTTDAGLQVVQETLSKWKIDNVVINDGSGLASTNRVSCSAFQEVLKKDIEIFPSLMAIAAESGTIKEVFTNEDVKSRLVAKTGTLNGVKALVGYLPIPNSEPVVFSLMLNGAGIDNQNSYRPIWYALGNALNRAKSSPSLEQLLP